MFNRQRTGSVVCPSCGNLVGVRDERCYSCGRWNPGLWGFTPLLRRIGADFGFAELIIGTCSVLYLLTLLLSGPSIRMAGRMSFLSPAFREEVRFGASGALPVFELDRWWTFFSAGWLHGDLLHILFGMFWVRQLVPATAELFGTARTIIIYVIGGAIGFAASTVAQYYIGGAGVTLGSSAAVFALLGAMVHYGRQSSSIVKTQATAYAVGFFVFGLLVPGIDNWAHGGGFVGGYFMSSLMNPLRSERGNHSLIAFGCLLATFLSFVASLLSPIPPFPF